MSLDRLNEAFKLLDALNEDMFDTSLDGINSLADAMDGDNTDDIIKVVDVDAETEEDVQDSYLGKVILNCNVCHSLRFANKDEIEIDDSGIVNGEEACPYCGESEGFTIIGQIEEFGEGEDTEEPTNENEEPLDDNTSEIAEPKNNEENETEFKESFKRHIGKRLNESGKSVDFARIKKLGKKLIKESATDVTDQVELDAKEQGVLTKKKELEAQGYKVQHTGNGKITMVKPKELTEAPIYDLDDDEVNFLTNRRTTRVDISDREAKLIDKRRDLLNKYVIGFNYGAYQFVKIPTKDLARYIDRCLCLDDTLCSGDEVMQLISTDEVNTLKGAVIYDTRADALEAVEKMMRFDIFADDATAHDFIIQIKDLPKTVDITSAAPMLTESPYYLDTKYDSRKSFYNKAMVSDNTDELYSYGVHVMSIENGKPVIKCREDQLSQTTLRHIKEFLKQKGFPAISKQQIIKDYMVECASNECINEDLRNSPYNTIIVRHFDYTGSDRFFDIIADLIDRVEDFSNEEEIWEAIDSGLIYTRDQWEVYMHYCDMGDSTDKMYESLFSDIFAICDAITNSAEPTMLDESLKSYMKGRLNKRFVEGFNNINVETEEQKLTMTQDENGKVTVTTEPLAAIAEGSDLDVDATATEGDETISPVTDELADELIGATSEEDTDETVEDEGEALPEEEPTEDGEVEEEPTDEEATDAEGDFEESFNRGSGSPLNEFIGNKKKGSISNKMFSGNTLNFNFSGNTSNKTSRDTIKQTDAKVDAKVAEVGAEVGANVQADAKVDAKVKADVDARVAADVGADGASVGVCGGKGGDTDVKKPADDKEKPIEKAMEKTMDEGVGDWYRKTFDRPASVTTQQMWEDELNGEFGEISDRRRDALKRKFERQRDWEKRHNYGAYENQSNNEVDMEIKDFDEVSFSTLGEKYLKNVYENVASFNATNVSNNDRTLIVEGVISFTSGVKKKTGFIFEADSATRDGSVRFVGGNKHFSNSGKAFVLNGKLHENKLFTESFSYNYRPTNSKNRIVGKVRSK